MKYLHFPITASAGDTVVVSLDSQANVRLLDPINYSRYHRGERHEFYGGLARVSPFRHLNIQPFISDHLVNALEALRGRG